MSANSPGLHKNPMSKGRCVGKPAGTTTLKEKILWLTRYLILVAAAVISLVLIWHGHVTGTAGGAVVLWRAVKFLGG